jgi:hypothetical protein
MCCWACFTQAFFQHSDFYFFFAKDCNLLKIKELAQNFDFSMEMVFEQKKWGERFWVLECQRVECR